MLRVLCPRCSVGSDWTFGSGIAAIGVNKTVSNGKNVRNGGSAGVNEILSAKKARSEGERTAAAAACGKDYRAEPDIY